MPARFERIPLGVRWRLVMLLVVLALPVTAAVARAGVPLRFDAGGGLTLVVYASPFRLALVGPGGVEEIGTVPGNAGTPFEPPAINGPQPLEPLGAAGGYPALGWVTGVDFGLENPAPPFTGNRLFGADAGVVVSATSIKAVSRDASAVHLTLNTDLAGTASLDISRLQAPAGVRLRLTPPAGLRVGSSMVTLASPPGEGLYGGGARRDAFDARGLLRNVWTEEQYFGDGQTEPATGLDPTRTTGPAYTAPDGAQMAFYALGEIAGSRGWTAWMSRPELQRLDLAATSPDKLRWAVAGPVLDLSLAGGGLASSIASYTAAEGRAPAPPRYVYQPWLDRINQNGEGEAAPNGGGFSGGPAVAHDLPVIVAKIRADALPIRTIGVEGWQAVPDGARLFGSLRRDGFDLMAYWNPFLAPGKTATVEAIKRGVVITDSSGRPYGIVTNRGNVSYAVDFSAPGAQAFWDEQLARSCALGFEGTHADFGEFVEQGMYFHDGESAQTMHNRYPILYAEATRNALAGCHSGQPFFYVRAGSGPMDGGPGSAASTPAVIVGDESTDFSRGSGLASLAPAMLNLAMSGTSTFISDIGGYFDLYTPPTTAELFTRWSQFSSLTPVMRIHDDTEHGSLYPWNYDAATLDTYRRYARMHERLIPLFERWARRAAATGTIGPVRPLLLDDPSRTALGVSDEWMLGHDILAAPVVRQGSSTRRVYLPIGASWQRVTVGESGHFEPQGRPLAGGTWVTVATPLGDAPIFLRAARFALSFRHSRLSLAGPDLAGVLYVKFFRGQRPLARVDRPPFSTPARARGGRLSAVVHMEEGTAIKILR